MMILSTLTNDSKKIVLRQVDGLLALIVISIVCFSLAWFGWLEWPGMHWDADFFASVVMNVARKQEWTFDSYSQFLLKRPSNIYNFHGILQVWFYGTLLHTKDWRSLSMAMAGLNICSYLTYALLFKHKLARHHGPSSSWLKAAILAVVPAVICIGLQGRPEQLAVLLLAVPWLIRQRRPLYGIVVVGDGVTLGALFLLSPLVGLIAGVVLLVLQALYRKGSLLGNWCYFAARLAVALVFSVAVFQLITPFTFVEWIQNLRSAGTAIPWNWVFSNQETFQWGTTILAPFWSLVIAAAVVILIAQLFAKKEFLVLSAAVAALIWTLSRGLDYSYSPFVPAVMLLWLDDRLVLVEGQGRIGRLCANQLPLMFAVLYTIVLIEQISYSIVVFREGGTPVAARNLIQSVTAEESFSNGGTLATTMAQGRAGVVLDSPANPTISLPWAKSMDAQIWPFWSLHLFEKRYLRHVQYFVLQQAHGVIYNPPPKEIYLDRDQPFVLVKDGWRRKFSFWDRHLRPLRLGNGYWLAVYRRVDQSAQHHPRARE